MSTMMKSFWDRILIDQSKDKEIEIRKIQVSYQSKGDEQGLGTDVRNQTGIRLTTEMGLCKVRKILTMSKKTYDFL